jgi:hypothetical protein
LEEVYSDLKSTENNLQDFRKEHNYTIKETTIDPNALDYPELKTICLK